jgi:hypothetical protein
MFDGLCDVTDKTIEIYREGAKVVVRSKKTLAPPGLVLVLQVQNFKSIVQKTKKDDFKTVGSTVLTRACGAEDVGAEKMWVLLPFTKLPKKVAETNDPDKLAVIPAWLAKQVANRADCNMERIDMQCDVVHSFGAGDNVAHAESSVVSIPVFTNFLEVKAGDELIIHWDAEVTKSAPKRAEKTWRAAAVKAKDAAKKCKDSVEQALAQKVASS